MKNKELQNLVEKIAVQNFAEPFKHQATFNARLRTTGGRYLLATHNIEINPRLASDYPLPVLIGVIKHELCHYYLHLAHQGYQHRDHDFRILLKRVGGSRFSPASLRPRAHIIYECRECHHRYYRQRHLDPRRYCCSQCGGKLKLIENN